MTGWGVSIWTRAESIIGKRHSDRLNSAEADYSVWFAGGLYREGGGGAAFRREVAAAYKVFAT